MSSYDAFLSGRMASAMAVGIGDASLSSDLFPYQRAIVEWALARGRSAVFADTGLGKTLMQLEWARAVSTRGRVLIIAPLAVAEQTVREGGRFGIPCIYCRADDGESKIVVTNYEHVEKFDPRAFVGVVLDESSIIKSSSGAYRNLLIAMFTETPFRLACTATPAPNDHIELGNHCEFLGIKTQTEMLAEYFVHDGGSTQDWRIKGHAEDAFWRWVCSWAIMIRMPSDLGFDDAAFKLPALRMHEHVIPVDHKEAHAAGFLFAPEAVSLNEQRAVRRSTVEKRVDKIAELSGGPGAALIWCELNDEADDAAAAIPGAVQVAGGDDYETKADRLLGFAEGRYRALVTKPKIAGFGMNWQHCNRVIFAGASHSYEQTYQAIRRCWRFGQKRPVDVHIIRSESESAVIENFRRKEAAAERMRAQMLEHMRSLQGVRGSSKEWNPYAPTVAMKVPQWIGQEASQ